LTLPLAPKSQRANCAGYSSASRLQRLSLAPRSGLAGDFGDLVGVLFMLRNLFDYHSGRRLFFRRLHPNSATAGKLEDRV
jgi:hypothetical protein